MRDHELRHTCTKCGYATVLRAELDSHTCVGLIRKDLPIEGFICKGDLPTPEQREHIPTLQWLLMGPMASGRTHLLALMFMSMALTRPGYPIRLWDHTNEHRMARGPGDSEDSSTCASEVCIWLDIRRG